MDEARNISIFVDGVTLEVHIFTGWGFDSHEHSCTFSGSPFFRFLKDEQINQQGEGVEHQSDLF